MPILLFVLLLAAVDGINLLQMADGPGESWSVAKVLAVEGGEARLPCPLEPAQRGDSVYLVLWYRRDGKTPIYSFDSRASSGGGAVVGAPDLWSEPKVFGPRAEFRVSDGGMDAVLVVQRVTKAKDEGEYTCRVDFRQSPTQYHRVRLSVIVPPQTPVIVEPGGRPVQGSMLGPLQQGEPLTLDCKVQGGLPSPKVVWYRDSTMIDDTDLRGTGGEMQNRLVLNNIPREHLGARYRCLAINNNMTSPAESEVQVNVYFPPLGVKISTGGTPFSVGRDYTVRCITWGSNPPASLTWTRTNGRRASNKHLTVINETTRWNFTESVMLYRPRPAHHGQSLQCSASNELTSRENSQQDSTTLEVFFAPTVSLHIGKALNLNDLEEGDDVYFECSIQANPAAYKVTWLHNGMEVVQRPDKQMFISNQSLVLQKVSREQAGNYSCHASNVEGDAESDPVTLTIMYVPVCDDDQPAVYGVSENETVSVSCSVKSYPSAVSFTWSFNNSLTSSLLPTNSYTQEAGTSTITYTPHSHMEFGTLLCWGTNLVGNQKTSQPCVFHIIPTSAPDPPRRCAMGNRTASSITFACIAGYGGGLPQKLHLTLVSPLAVVVVNTSVPVGGEAEPIGGGGVQEEIGFTVDRLPPDTRFRAVVFASNQRGRSTEKVMEVSTLARLRGAGDTGSVLSEAGRENRQAELPLLAVVCLAAALTLLALGAALLTATSVRRRMNIKQEQGRREEVPSKNGVGGGHGTSWRQVPLSPSVGQDKSPDIIKDTKGEVAQYEMSNDRQAEQRMLYRDQSFPGLSPYPMASVNSPPDGGFPSQPHHQHPASEPDGGYNNTPGFTHLAAEPGIGGPSQAGKHGGGDGYHHQQDISYPQAGSHNEGGFPSQPFPEYTYWAREDRQYYRDTSSSYRPALPQERALPLCSEALAARAGGLRTPLLEDDRESCV